MLIPLTIGNIAMHHFDALGRAGGARRVDDIEAVLGADLDRLRFVVDGCEPVFEMIEQHHLCSQPLLAWRLGTCKVWLIP